MLTAFLSIFLGCSSMIITFVYPLYLSYKFEVRSVFLVCAPVSLTHSFAVFVFVVQALEKKFQTIMHRMSLAELLDIPAAFQAFLAFCASEFASENVLFYHRVKVCSFLFVCLVFCWFALEFVGFGFDFVCLIGFPSELYCVLSATQHSKGAFLLCLFLCVSFVISFAVLLSDSLFIRFASLYVGCSAVSTARPSCLFIVHRFWPLAASAFT